MKNTEEERDFGSEEGEGNMYFQAQNTKAS